MKKIVAIISGRSHWDHANLDHIVVSADVDIDRELKLYEESDSDSFVEWLKQRGGKPATEVTVVEV